MTNKKLYAILMEISFKGCDEDGPVTVLSESCWQVKSSSAVSEWHITSELAA